MSEILHPQALEKQAPALTEVEFAARLRMNVVDKLLQGAACIALLGVPASISRTFITGWLPLYTAHLALGAIAITIYLLRNKLPLLWKFGIVLVLFSGVGIGGLLQLGLLGVGMWWLVVAGLLVSIMFSARMGLLAGGIVVVVVLAIGWGYVNGVLKANIDADVYLASWSSWLTLLIATSIMPFFVFQAISTLQFATTDLLQQVSGQRDEIHELATRDPLTGLLSAREMSERLTITLSSARRHGHRVAVMFVDLDHFKAVNDNLGHDAGDFLLRELGHRYAKLVRDSDAVGRIGGDEFLFVLDQPGSESQVAEIAQRLVEVSIQPVEYAGQSITVGASVGISLFPEHGDSADELRTLADKAMYEVKKHHKNGYRFATTSTLASHVEATATPD